MLRSLILSVTFGIAIFPGYTVLAQQQTPQPTPAPRPAPAVRPQQPSTPPKPKPAATPATPQVKKPAPGAAPATAATPAETKARLLEKIKDWTIFIHEGQGGRICFAASVPSDMQPKAAKRTPVIFYLTTWQKDGIRNEVSVKQGYSLKANTPATVTVGKQDFKLTPEDDKAFVKEPADERKLITAMSGGGSMVVKAVSAKGTATVDQYSLAGLPEAIQKIQEACP